MRIRAYPALAAPLAVAVLLLTACNLFQPTTVRTVPVDFEVTLERGPCFGGCPVYNLTLSADGQVVFDGVRFVTMEGRQTASLGSDEVLRIAQTVVDADFFGLEGEYTVKATDLPSITLTITMDGRTKQVYHYGVGCGTELDIAPPGLCDLEAAIEAIPVANGWVSGP